MNGYTYTQADIYAPTTPASLQVRIRITTAVLGDQRVGDLM